MPKVLDQPSHSLKEFRILPGHTTADGSAPNVSLETRLCRSGNVGIGADHILVLHHGEVPEQGQHEELVRLDGIYARLHRLQYPRVNGMGPSPISLPGNLRPPAPVISL